MQIWKKKRKKAKISFLQKTLSSKLHEVSPATAQKSIIKKKIKIILFHPCWFKISKKNNGRERRRHLNLLWAQFSFMYVKLVHRLRRWDIVRSEEHVQNHCTMEKMAPLSYFNNINVTSIINFLWYFHKPTKH